MKFVVNEIFYSIQGEGHRAGSANVFVRFSACNLRCNVIEHGFDCDTDFSGGMEYTQAELVKKVKDVDRYDCKNIIWTGGEPSLQLTSDLVDSLPEFHHAVETNGTRVLPQNIDFASVSPKTAEHTLRIGWASELRYVRNVDQALPKPSIVCEHNFLSPAFQASGQPDLDALNWCRKLVKENPTWRLSLQTHKLLQPIR